MLLHQDLINLPVPFPIRVHFKDFCPVESALLRLEDTSAADAEGSERQRSTVVLVENVVVESVIGGGSGWRRERFYLGEVERTDSWACYDVGYGCFGRRDDRNW